MAYFSQTDIERYTGFSSSSFKEAGVTMTSTQWNLLCATIIDVVTQQINSWCQVTSFEPHTVTEYKNGKGATGDNNTYREEDVCFYLFETATSVISVYEDTSSKTATPDWTLRTERSATTAGDYEFLKEYDLSYIRFHNNIPRKGKKNVKITYWGGYATGSPELNEIKIIACRIAKNYLLEKKKVQESTTLRQTGISDFAPMFDPKEGMYNILTDDIKSDLIRYKMFHMGGPTWE